MKSDPMEARNQAKPTETLTATQIRAVELLISGRGVTKVAKDVEVGRTTLWRWMRKDNIFRAELNRQRNALKEGMTDRLHAIADEALSTVEGAVQEGNVSAALAILKGSGILDGNWPVQLEDPFDLALVEGFRSWGQKTPKS